MTNNDAILTEMSHVTISEIVVRNIEATLREHTINVIKKLAEVYKFDAEEAMSYMTWDIKPLAKPKTSRKKKDASSEDEVKPKKAKEARLVPSIPLPWCGEVVEDWCQAIRSNHGLFTQCTNERVDGKDLCKTCEKTLAKTTSGELKYGLAADRQTFPLKVTPYISVMKKQNITKETAIEEAAKFGWTIPENAFDEVESKRGRPKKDTSDVSSEDKSKSPGKRGRPKKEKPLASASATDDMLASVIAQASALSLGDASESSGISGDSEASPKKKRVLSDEQKAKMAEGRARKAAEKAEQKRAEAAAEAEAIRKAAEANTEAETEVHSQAEGTELTSEDMSAEEEFIEHHAGAGSEFGKATGMIGGGLTLTFGSQVQTEDTEQTEQTEQTVEEEESEDSESEEDSSDDGLELETKVIGGKTYHIDTKTNNVYKVDSDGNGVLYGVYDQKKNKVVKNKN
jgi:uncharacterized FlaG/YvyC family protein